MQGVDWRWFSRAFDATNWGGTGWHPVAIALLCFVACLALSGPRALMIAPAALASLFTAVLKAQIDRPRPPADLLHVQGHVGGFSYPSGHATFYAWLSVTVVLVLGPRLGRWRTLAWAGAAIVVTVGCLGRVWAGAHWPSDVIGGACLGATWAIVVLVAWQLAGRRRSRGSGSS
ncbi:MAG: phosphatase PAP2 family protein [Candidatus Dormibacteraceae bacterium]